MTKTRTSARTKRAKTRASKSQNGKDVTVLRSPDYDQRLIIVDFELHKNELIDYGGFQILVQKVFERDLSCDDICKKLKFKCIF